MQYSEDNIKMVEAMYSKYLVNSEDYNIEEDDDKEKHVYFIKTNEERELLNNSIYEKYKDIYAEFSNHFDNTVFVPINGRSVKGIYSDEVYLIIDEETNTIYNIIG